MQNNLPPSPDWPFLLVWAAVTIFTGASIGAIVNGLLGRRKTNAEGNKYEAEGEEAKARASKTAGEAFHMMLDDLTKANERLEEQRERNGALSEEKDRVKMLLENCERKERRRLSQEAQRPRVLLVEDQDEMRELCRMRFRIAPFKLDMAEDGQDALEQYNDAIRLGFPFKLLVLDYSMPGMSGVEVGRKIRTSGDVTTKFILWTAYPQPALEDDLLGLFAEKERVITKQNIAELECEILDALGLSGKIRRIE
jgi:CheY-like chemotaxis protein